MRRYLKRLNPHHYQGMATVHWVMTIDRRLTGWLDSGFHLRFREILLHTSARHDLIVPCYCLMPDHIHILMRGVKLNSQQLNAVRFFRRHINLLLSPSWRLQRQAFDHVLRDNETRTDALRNLIFYILANPVRAGLVEKEQNHTYPYCGCMVTGYPKLNVFSDDFVECFWKLWAKQSFFEI